MMKLNFFQKAQILFNRALDVLLWIAVFILIVVILSVMIEVFLRYFFNRPQEWVVEISEYALLYITFLSCTVVLRKEGHIVVDLLTSRLSSRTRLFLSVLQYLAISLVAVVFIYVGGKTALDNYLRGIYNPTLLQIPIAYTLMIIPIGGFFLFIQSIIGLCSYYKKFKTKTTGAQE